MFERFVDDPSDYLISVTDSSGKIIYVNKKFQDISKYSESEILGNSHRLIKSGYHNVVFYRNLWHTLLNGETWTGFIKNKAKDDTHYWVRSTMIPMSDTNKKPYQFICISTKLEHPNEEMLDFTDIENIQKTLDQSSIVAITDKDGTITYVNKKFCDISKYSKEELIGQNHRILKSGFHPQEFYQNMWNTINRGEIWFGEIKNKNKNQEYYWVKTVIMPFKDDLNNIQQFMSIRTDITEIHESREKINDQLVQLKKTNKQKDEFISMISHELKSPIFPIIGYCDLLKDPELSKNFNTLHFEALDEITSSAKKLQRITEDLLDVNKIHMKKLQYNITKLSLAEFATHIIKEHIHLMEKKQIEFYILPVEEQIIESDEQRLMQVITNIIRNAVDFVPDKNGKITISIHYESEMPFLV